MLLLALTGCFHNSPEEEVLAPVVAEFTQAAVDQSKQPEYIVFADDFTAKIFESLRRDPRYRILSTGKPIVCPSGGTPCPQPYELSARVNSIEGDSAFATIQRIDASGGGHPIAYGEQILLVRRNGRWKVEKVLGYSATLLM